MYLNYLYNKYVMFYVFCYLLIPIGLFSTFKSFLFLVLLLFSFFVIQKYSRHGIFVLLTFVAFCLLQTLNSILSGFYEKELFLELKSIIGLFFSIIVINTAFKYNYLNKIEYVNTIIFSCSVYILLKIILIFGFVFNNQLSIAVINHLNFKMDFNFNAYGFIPRLVFSNDIITPVLFLSLLLLKHKYNYFRNKYFYGIAMLLFLLNIIITFSRYYIICIIIGSFVYYIFFSNKNIVKNIRYLFRILLLLIISVFFLENIFDQQIFEGIKDIWKLRLSIEGSYSSNEKLDQYKLFFNRIINGRPLFGNGMGTYISDYLRDKNIRYGYEAFFMLLIYQFGFVGIMYILLLYIGKYIKCKNDIKNKNVLYIILINMLLFGNCFVNPQILNSIFAIPYTFLNVVYLYIKDVKNETM